MKKKMLVAVSLTVLMSVMMVGCATTKTAPYDEFSKVRPIGKELAGAYEMANKYQVCDCIGMGSVTSTRFVESLPEARAKAENDLAMCVKMVRASGRASAACSGLDLKKCSTIYVREDGEVFALAFLENSSR